ncbi:hypothetical protein DUI87_16936 [Hirundo rustica rustica]|uniref:Lysosomal Pro-X carboxypeptidase n=1 Tax=Hirundo rustica rustica TaxID=333673 RepID=A0A3M0K7Z9_HIRRU|nr:hypothetical protein DUI87_16936 [Hirundo rustica rustica]
MAGKLPRIDHFGFDENRTFQQRYLVADQYWRKDSGPILFYTGNEGDIEWFCNNTGFMWDVAEELNAMLVFAEHRYYGQSLPFGNESFSDSKHLNYLTSEQALADFAVLVEYLKTTIAGAQHSPVIAIGGSYGGMLAAWFRMKYPHVVAGALAASAPIWQFGDLVPCGTFFSIVTNDFKKSGPGCSESIRNSWGAVNHLSSTDGVHDMFEPQKWDFDALSEECYRMWGVRPRLSWMLSMYGGKNISSHSNIIFSNGGLDPWSAGGVTQNITDSLVAVVIPDGAHHLDLRGRNPLDPKSVQQARAMEVCLMKEWIEKARHSH